MQHSNGQSTCPNCHRPTSPESPVEITFSLLPAQISFLERLIDSIDAAELAESVRLVHDLALYHSDVPLEEAEKGRAVKCYFCK